jgi:hypothetical protein
VGFALLGGLLPGAGRAQGVPGGLGDEQRVAGLPGGQVTELHLAGPYLVWSVVTAQAVPGPPQPGPVGTAVPFQRPAPPVQQADVWLADLRVTLPHPQHLAGPLPPATRVSLAESLVVWSDSSEGRASAIVGRDLVTNAPITAPPVTGNQFLPAADGEWVVWSGSPNQTGAGIPEAQAITAWNRRTGELRTLDIYWLEPDPQRGPAPAIDGTQVAAIVRPMDGSTQRALRLYDLATGKARTVLTFPDETHSYSNLQLAGGWAVWEEPGVGPQGEAAARIVQVNLTDGKQIVRAKAARAGTLAAGSGGVAWRDLAEGTPLVAYPLNPQSEIAVRTLTPPQARPRGPVALSAGGVAWVDERDPATPAIYVRRAGDEPPPPPASDPFTRLWTRTDAPVAAGRVARSWVWGPRPEGLLARDRQEPYAEAPGLQRLVRYYDKGRMEINDPGANLEAPWAITSGLLVVEMVTGQVATGNTAAATVTPNTLPVAGDPDSPAAPPYAALAGAMINPQSERALPGPRSGEPVTTWMDRAGTLSEHPAPALVRYAAYDETAHHNIPDVFLAFMTQRGLVHEDGTDHEAALFDPLFTFGYPLIEPVWITIRVGGQDRTVLFQAFERRTLTYTPTNAPAWQVEMGNVGAHYYAWRYER